MSARDLLRKKEASYSEHNLADQTLTEDQLINYIIQYPMLLERPIVVIGEKAAMGRPPENILALL